MSIIRQFQRNSMRICVEMDISFKVSVDSSDICLIKIDDDETFSLLFSSRSEILFSHPFSAFFFPWTSEETWWKWWLICWTLTVIAHFFGTIKRNPEEREREKESHLPLCRVSMSVSRVRVCAAACVSPWIRDKAPPSSFLLDFSLIFLFSLVPSQKRLLCFFVFNQRRKMLSDSLLRVVAPSSTTTWIRFTSILFLPVCVCFPLGSAVDENKMFFKKTRCISFFLLRNRQLFSWLQTKFSRHCVLRESKH